MALKSTIYKADCQISDMDRGYYQSHNLTIAQHPSDKFAGSEFEQPAAGLKGEIQGRISLTEERMMVRLLAFMINADEQLQFTKGLSTDDEPELWQKNLTDDIELWIEVGMPDEKRIRKASSRADKVIVYTYGGRNTVRWNQIQPKLERFKNLTVINLPKEATDQLSSMVKRTMQLQISIQNGQVWVSDDQTTANIVPETWLN
jgi:uncharacterized protein YaeQ